MSKNKKITEKETEDSKQALIETQQKINYNGAVVNEMKNTTFRKQ